MNLLFLRKNPSETALIVYLLAIGLVGLPYAEIGAWFSADAALAQSYGLVVCRLLAAALMLAFAAGLGLRGALFPRAGSGRIAAVALPALLIACNNLPIVALARGTAGVTASAFAIVPFALQCLFVAAFEETTFRGILFPLFLQEYGTDRRGRLKAVLISSALFGALHLVNLLAGGSVGAVLLQAGYSFLIGAMLAVVTCEGGSVILCTLLHAVYNFCGLLVPELGFGSIRAIWNLPTVIVTAALAVAVFVWLLIRFLRADGAPARSLIAVRTQEIALNRFASRGALRESFTGF